MKAPRLYVYYADVWITLSDNPTEPLKPQGSAVVGYYENLPSVGNALSFLKDQNPVYKEQYLKLVHFKKNTNVVLLMDNLGTSYYLSNIRRGERYKKENKNNNQTNLIVI